VGSFKIQNRELRILEFSDDGLDFALIGEAPDLMFGKYENAIHVHVEDPASTLNQRGVGIKRSLQLGRQPGGSWLVVSSSAVFN